VLVTDTYLLGEGRFTLALLLLAAKVCQAGVMVGQTPREVSFSTVNVFLDKKK
jgi:hypothetical protein